MKRASEILQGIQQFSRTENPQTGPVHPIRELAWLSRRAVQEDHNLSGVGEQSALTETGLRLQRLREVVAIFTEVFILQEYKWEPHSETPRVIDLGGDIGGLTVLYWKSVAPEARVTLIEGAEGAVLRELAEANKLNQIDEIIMEFHNDPANPSNALSQVLATLENAGFTIENAHRSGARRGLRAEALDVNAIRSSDTIIFMINAKKPQE